MEQEEKVIIAFINPSSGGGQGVKIFNELKTLLELDWRQRVYDIKEEKGPRRGLEEWREQKDLIIIAGGGDGTVGWVLTIIDTISFPADHPPQVVPLALGTANDMARILNWGTGYTGESLSEFINIIKKSEPILLDRWEVTVNKLSEEQFKEFAVQKEDELREGKKIKVKSQKSPRQNRDKTEKKDKKQRVSNETIETPPMHRSPRNLSNDSPSTPTRPKSPAPHFLNEFSKENTPQTTHLLSSDETDAPPRPKAPIPKSPRGGLKEELNWDQTNTPNRPKSPTPQRTTNFPNEEIFMDRSNTPPVRPKTPPPQSPRIVSNEISKETIPFSPNEDIPHPRSHAKSLPKDTSKVTRFNENELTEFILIPPVQPSIITNEDDHNDQSDTPPVRPKTPPPLSIEIVPRNIQEFPKEISHPIEISNEMANTNEVPNENFHFLITNETPKEMIPEGSRSEPKITTLSTTTTEFSVVITPEEERLEPKEQSKSWVANNYFSIGIDSKILLQYESIRHAHPSCFPHRLVNKSVIGFIGIKSVIEGFRSLRHYCFLKIKEPGTTNWKQIALPKKAGILVFLNVPSYSSGINPWKQARNINTVPEITPQSINDGVIEVIAMDGPAHVVLTMANLSRGGTRIGQAEAVELITLQILPGQVDGEPYYLHPCKITIKRTEKQSVMLINNPIGEEGTKSMANNKIEDLI